MIQPSKKSQRSLATAELRKQLEGDFSDEFEYDSGGEEKKTAERKGDLNTEERRFQAQQERVLSVNQQDDKVDLGEKSIDEYERDEFI